MNSTAETLLTLETVDLQKLGKVALLTLNRPRRLNAMNRLMLASVSGGFRSRPSPRSMATRSPAGLNWRCAAMSPSPGRTHRSACRNLNSAPASW
jgi:hypothetical protein